VINACIAWYLTHLGVLDRAVAMLPWSMPAPLGAAWSANGSWKNLFMCLFALQCLDDLPSVFQRL
jgi:PTS system cellobiose-specific IIC component